MSTYENNSNGDGTKAQRSSRRRLLKTCVGVAATTLGVPILGSTATAHFPPSLEIDVKSESDSNAINPRSRGVVPVAVLRTDEFDLTSEDVRYRFGSPDAVAAGDGECPIHEGYVEYVNAGRFRRLDSSLPVQDAGFDGDESEAELRWERDKSGEHGLAGRDEVRMVGRGVN